MWKITNIALDSPRFGFSQVLFVPKIQNSTKVYICANYFQFFIIIFIVINSYKSPGNDNIHVYNYTKKGTSKSIYGIVAAVIL